jgi:hypothetical protein
MSGISRTSSSLSCRPAACRARTSSLMPSTVSTAFLFAVAAAGMRRSNSTSASASADAVTADAFHQRFGGTRLTYSPVKPGRPTGPRARYQPSYSPRVVDGKIMTPADLRRLHKYMLEIENVTVISDEMRALVESEWPDLAPKLPLAKPQP